MKKKVMVIMASAVAALMMKLLPDISSSRTMKQHFGIHKNWAEVNSRKGNYDHEL